VGTVGLWGLGVQGRRRGSKENAKKAKMPNPNGNGNYGMAESLIHWRGDPGVETGNRDRSSQSPKAVCQGVNAVKVRSRARRFTKQLKLMKRSDETLRMR
jgi:hypothetical protein